jgi:hypothetical protein
MTARVAFLRRSSQDNAEKHGEKARAGYQQAFREGGFEVQRRSKAALLRMIMSFTMRKERSTPRA